MRLNGLGPSPSLYNQRQGHNNGPVDENKIEEPIITDEKQSEDPLDDPQIRSEVAQLQTIEDKVIAHEQAHKAVGGEFTGAASYGYSVGPDGKRYITSGEVSISVPGSGEPEDLIRAMERVKNAALAPMNPSGQDQSVAASASAKIISLQSEISKKKGTETYNSNGGPEKDIQEYVQNQSSSERDHIDIKI